MSEITNDGLTRSGTGYFIAVDIWHQWMGIKGLRTEHSNEEHNIKIIGDRIDKYC